MSDEVYLSRELNKKKLELITKKYQRKKLNKRIRLIENNIEVLENQKYLIHLNKLKNSILSPNIFSIISNFLSPNDLFLILPVSKYIYELAKSEIKKKWKIFLRKRIPSSINIDKFSQILYSTGSIISGSFMIQFFHNEKYLNSDIDIYCPNEEAKKSIENLFGEKFNMSGEKNFSYESQGIGYNSHSYRVNDKYQYGFLKINQQTFQVTISNKFRNIISFISFTFDYTFLINYYDGKKIKFNYIKDLSQKKISKNNDFYYDNQGNEDIVKKYQKRGFN